MKTMILMAAAATAIVNASAASAVGIDFTWTDTLSASSSVPGGTTGEVITTTITMDNGGTSPLSGIWGLADFVSYRIEGASGWWAETAVVTDGSGSFQTDATGVVTSVASLIGGYFFSGSVNTSWAGAGTGGFWNNGRNEVFCTTSLECVWAENVTVNLVAGSWTASVAAPTLTPVPVPASLPLLVAGFAGLAGLRMRKRQAARV